MDGDSGSVVVIRALHNSALAVTLHSSSRRGIDNIGFNSLSKSTAGRSGTNQICVDSAVQIDDVGCMRRKDVSDESCILKSPSSQSGVLYPHHRTSSISRMFYNNGSFAQSLRRYPTSAVLGKSQSAEIVQRILTYTQGRNFARRPQSNSMRSLMRRRRYCSDHFKKTRRKMNVSLSLDSHPDTGDKKYVRNISSNGSDLRTDNMELMFHYLKPVTTKPAPTKPATTKPATTKPATTKPATTKPATTKPATTNPATVVRYLTCMKQACKSVLGVCDDAQVCPDLKSRYDQHRLTCPYASKESYGCPKMLSRYERHKLSCHPASKGHDVIDNQVNQRSCFCNTPSTCSCKKNVYNKQPLRLLRDPEDAKDNIKEWVDDISTFADINGSEQRKDLILDELMNMMKEIDRQQMNYEEAKDDIARRLKDLRLWEENNEDKYSFAKKIAESFLKKFMKPPLTKNEIKSTVADIVNRIPFKKYISDGEKDHMLNDLINRLEPLILLKHTDEDFKDKVKNEISPVIKRMPLDNKESYENLIQNFVEEFITNFLMNKGSNVPNKSENMENTILDWLKDLPGFLNISSNENESLIKPIIAALKQQDHQNIAEKRHDHQHIVKKQLDEIKDHINNWLKNTNKNRDIPISSELINKLSMKLISKLLPGETNKVQLMSSDEVLSIDQKNKYPTDLIKLVNQLKQFKSQLKDDSKNGNKINAEIEDLLQKLINKKSLRDPFIKEELFNILNEIKSQSSQDISYQNNDDLKKTTALLAKTIEDIWKSRDEDDGIENEVKNLLDMLNNFYAAEIKHNDGKHYTETRIKSESISNQNVERKQSDRKYFTTGQNQIPIKSKDHKVEKQPSDKDYLNNSVRRQIKPETNGRKKWNKVDIANALQEKIDEVIKSLDKDSRDAAISKLNEWVQKNLAEIITPHANTEKLPMPKVDTNLSDDEIKNVDEKLFNYITKLPPKKDVLPSLIASDSISENYSSDSDGKNIDSKKIFAMRHQSQNTIDSCNSDNNVEKIVATSDTNFETSIPQREISNNLSNPTPPRRYSNPRDRSDARKDREKSHDQTIKNAKSSQESPPIKSVLKYWLDKLNLFSKEIENQIADILAKDIMDRQKYLKISNIVPSTNEELEHLRYQIFKRLKDILGDIDLHRATSKTDELYERIKDMQHGNLKNTITSHKETFDTKKGAQENMLPPKRLFKTSTPQKRFNDSFYPTLSQSSIHEEPKGGSYSEIIDNQNSTISRNFEKSLHIKELLKKWLDDLNLFHKEFDNKIIDVLTKDILDRQKYLRISNTIPSDMEELEHLSYQIFKRLNNMLNDTDLYEVISKTNDLFERLKHIQNDTINKEISSKDLSSHGMKQRETRDKDPFFTNNTISPSNVEFDMASIPWESIKKLIENLFMNVSIQQGLSLKKLEKKIENFVENVTQKLLNNTLYGDKIGEFLRKCQSLKYSDANQYVLHEMLQIINKVIEELTKKTREEVDLAMSEYKQRIRDTLSNTLPFLDGIDPSFEELKDKLADAFVSLHYIADNANEKDEFKRKIREEIDNFCSSYLRRFPTLELDLNHINEDLYNVLTQVPSNKQMTPINDVISEIIKEIKGRTDNVIINERTDSDKVTQYTPMIPPSTLSDEDRAHLETVRARNGYDIKKKIASPIITNKDAACSPPPISVSVQTETTIVIESNCQIHETKEDAELSPKVFVNEYHWNSNVSNKEPDATEPPLNVILNTPPNTIETTTKQSQVVRTPVSPTSNQAKPNLAHQENQNISRTYGTPERGRWHVESDNVSNHLDLEDYDVLHRIPPIHKQLMGTHNRKRNQSLTGALPLHDQCDLCHHERPTKCKKRGNCKRKILRGVLEDDVDKGKSFNKEINFDIDCECSRHMMTKCRTSPMLCGQKICGSPQYCDVPYCPYPSPLYFKYNE